MEAATPLRPRRVHALVGRLIVENVVVDDPVAAELVSHAIEAGEDPARIVADMIEIGARVLEREQAGSSVEVLRADMEKASREVEERLGATSEQVVTELRTRLEEAFGPDQGHVTRVLQRHFGAESTHRGPAPGPHRRRRAAQRVARAALQAVLLAPTSPTRSPPSRSSPCRRSASPPTSSTPTCAR